MAKKSYYYEVITDFEIPIMARLSKQQRARFGEDEDPPLEMLHVFHAEAAVKPDGMRRTRGMNLRRNGDIIKTDRPVGKSYTEIVRKLVSRPIISAVDGGRTLKRVMRPTVSKVKLRLLEPDEITSYVVENAICAGELGKDGRPMFGKGSRWGDALFVDSTADVTLPPETAALLATAQAMIEGSETADLGETPEGAA